MAGIVHECLFCPQTFASASAKDDHILEHFAQETCMECDQNLIRIGNNLYTLHNAVTCVKIIPKLEHNDSHLIESTTSGVNQSAEENLCQNGDNFIKQDNEMTAEHYKIKIEETSCDEYDEIELIPYEDDDESIGSSDMPGTSSYVKSAYEDETPIEMDDDFNEQTEEEDADDSDQNESSSRLPTGRETNSLVSPVFNAKCGICRLLFLNTQKLNTHMRSVHMKSTPGSGFECDICLKKVKTKNGLHIHKRYVHDEAGLWKFNCESCNASFMQESSLKRHQCGDKLRCEFCDKSGFNSIFALKSHVAFKHRKGRDTVNHECKLCTRTFETAEKRDEHRKICSYKRNMRASKICGERWCDSCLYKFDNNSLLRKHIQDMHKDCQKFECDSCCAIFMKQSSYDHHFCKNLKTNHIRKNSRRVSCETCGKMLCNSNALQKHKVFFHSKPGTLFCSLCAQTFESQADHKVHQTECQLKRKMQLYKRYECNLCDFIAKTQIKLRDHITKNHKYQL